MMIMGFEQWPLRVVEDARMPPGMALIAPAGSSPIVWGPPENTAAWTAGAVAYGRREDAERGLRREPDRDHVWLSRWPFGTFRVSARATSLSFMVGLDPADLRPADPPRLVDPLPKVNPRAMIIEGI